MSQVVQATEFFVVGGPVQPDRYCYVERRADRELETAIDARQHCCVLGPFGIGKTSLLVRAARDLRRKSRLVALVDVAQLGAREEAAPTERRVFEAAHRVARDLKIAIDLDSWWRERSAVTTENLLVDFFWNVVLTNTTAPVVVFFDQIESALAAPLGAELLEAIAECDARRAREPDYGRLTFVLAGAASRESVTAAGAQPLDRLRSIELADFTTEEAYGLAVGFGGDVVQAQALMDRVHAWTNGQPYLTQKVARAVARKGGKLEDVERAVREQLLAPAALEDDALLARSRALLAERSPAARQARQLLRRVARGATVTVPADVHVREVLELSGIARRDSGGAVRYRNRVMREAFGARWLKSASPARWRPWAAVAAVLALAAVGAHAYLNYLPRPYERVLSSADADLAALEAAHRGLRRLPGFAERADRLLAEALRRRSAQATNVAAVARTDAQLRALPGRSELADRLLADFWLRKVNAAANAERRDAALLFALRAATGEGDAAPARGWVRELIGADYGSLERTVRLPGPAARSIVDWQTPPVLLLLSAGNEMERAPLGEAADDGAVETAAPSALAITALERELRVEGEGSAGDLELSVALAHAAIGEVAVTLTAPNGARARLELPDSDAASSQGYVFRADQGGPLAALADAERRGTWRLTLVDRRAGSSGTLGGWGLRFGDEVWRDDPPDGVAIPDPERTQAVVVDVPADGSFAIVRPAAGAQAGSVALWDLASGRLVGDFAPPAPPRDVAINATRTRLFAASETELTLWNVADAMQVARLETQTELVLPPVFSTDGGYFAIAERVEGTRPLYSLLRAVDGSLLGSLEGQDGVERWWLGPGARYLALLQPSHVLRIVDARTGRELARFEHAHAVARVLPQPDGASLITVDEGGEIRSWRVDEARVGGRLLGRAVNADGVSVARDGRRVAYAAGAGEVVVRDVASGARIATLRDDADDAPRVLLSPDGERLVTVGAERARSWFLGAVGAGEGDGADLGVATTGLAGSPAAALLGFDSGQLRVGAPGRELAAAAAASVDYVGHRGAVTAIAADADRGVVVTGGADGIVRAWSLGTGEPTTPVLAHAIGRGDGPVIAVALSSDGRAIASAGAGVVKIWNVSDASVARELPLSGAAAALAFSSGSGSLAIGDEAGARIARADPSEDPTTYRTGGAVTSVAFSRDGAQLAIGTASGDLTVVTLASGQSIAAPSLPGAVLGVEFTSDRMLLAVTGEWAHTYTVGGAALEPLHARKLPVVARPEPAFVAAGGERVRIAGFDASGNFRVREIDLATPPEGAPPPELLQRDWSGALGLALDADGEPTVTEP